MSPDQVTSEGVEESGATDGKVVLKAKTNTLVLKANQYRTGGTIVNEGTEDAWLSLGAGAAVESSGIYLKKEGGEWSLEGYDGEVRGIATEETDLSVLEIEKPTTNVTVEDESFTPEGPTEDETHAAPGWSAAPQSSPDAGE